MKNSQIWIITIGWVISFFWGVGTAHSIHPARRSRKIMWIGASIIALVMLILLFSVKS